MSLADWCLALCDNITSQNNQNNYSNTAKAWMLVNVIMFKEEMINEHFRWGRLACVFDVLIFYLLHLHSNELLRAQIFNICLLTI